MIHPTRAQFPTSSMEIASREARRLLSMEPINPLISTAHTTIPHGATNEHIITFTYEDGSRESFNGREWKKESPVVKFNIPSYPTPYYIPSIHPDAA